MTNQELRKENMELNQVIKSIHEDYDNLKLEHESILESLKSDFNDKQDNDFINYTEALEIENKKLHNKIKEYEERELEYKKTLHDLEDVFSKMSSHINK